MSAPVLSPVQATDLLLDSLGSATPQVTDELSERLVSWRNEVEARPMAEWVAA